MADPVLEQAAVERLCKLLNYAPKSYRNPNSPGVETGVDVELALDGRLVGVQVTEFHVDEGAGHSKAGSRARKNEVNIAKEALKGSGRVKAYGFSASADYLPSLLKRIEEKVKKANARPITGFDEIWLLVCAQVSPWGATGSTFISRDSVCASRLNSQGGALLHGSPFSRVFLMLMLEGVVYGWSPEDGEWRLLNDVPL